MSPLFALLMSAAGGFVWELPPAVIVNVEVTGELTAGGIPVRMRKLTVRQAPGEIGRHFLDSFKRQGLYVPPGMPYDRVLTGVDPQTVHTFTVLIQPIDPRHCGVILGEAEPLAARARELRDPLFPGAAHVLQTTFESGRTVSFQARASEAELSSFYAEVLPKTGFVREADGSWRGSGEALQIFVLPLPKEPGISRVVLVRQKSAEDPR